MSFTIMTTSFTIRAVFAGSRLANHYSAYALVPVTFFLLALAVAGCMGYGANLFGSALAALSGVTGMQFGYLLRLFVPRTRRRPMSPGSKRVHHDGPPQRRFGGHGAGE